MDTREIREIMAEVEREHKAFIEGCESLGDDQLNQLILMFSAHLLHLESCKGFVMDALKR